MSETNEPGPGRPGVGAGPPASAAVPSGAGGNQRGRATRDRILAAGDRCFESSGLAVTIDEVAAAAGTTRMTVHRHTGGRGPLVTQLVLRASTRLADSIAAVLGGPGSLDGRLVEAMVKTVLAVRTTPTLAQLFAGGDVSAPWPALDPDERVLGAVRDFYRPHLVELAEAGALRDGVDVDEAVAWLLAQALLVLVVPALAEDEDDLRRFFGHMAMAAVMRR